MSMDHHGVSLNGVGGLGSDWFSEVNETWYGQSFSLKIKEVVHHEKSKYQDIVVLESETYGRVLLLDGIIQCTSRDEFSYQEMIAHLPLFSHPCPKSVLVVGGGDGGVLREVAKHSTVEEIHHCEIDERVIEVSKEHLPYMAVGFDNPKITQHIQDGAEFARQNKGRFDVVITDSSDPLGPAVSLFKKTYFEDIHAALKPGGIMCMQGECIWFPDDLELIKGILKDCRSLYAVAKYATISIPTYPCGQIGFVLASKNKETVLEEPTRQVTEEEAAQMNLRYYDSEVHRAAFVLPRFAKKVFDS